MTEQQKDEACTRLADAIGPHLREFERYTGETITRIDLLGSRKTSTHTRDILFHTVTERR